LGGHLQCRRCDFINNDRGIRAIIGWPDQVDIDSCTFDGNNTAADGDINISNSTIINGADGVACYSGPYGKYCTVTNCHFEGLSGTVFSAGEELTVSNCTIVNNPCSILHGSAVEYGYYHAEISNCEIVNNGGGMSLGAYFTDVGILRLNNCLYANNEGGISVSGLWVAQIITQNCTFVDNSCNMFWVGGGNGCSASAYINKCIIVNNDGWGVAFSPWVDWAIMRCDVIGNGGGNYYDIPDQTGINGNISADPLFCNPDSGDYTIADASPCAPENNSCNELIGVYGVGCSAIPMITEVIVGVGEDQQHLLNHVPDIFWSYESPFDLPQDQYEVAVGTDDDWTYAEMWNPAPFSGEDTSVTYNGSPLLDGETYYLRARVNNIYVWSVWEETSFRMNSIPSVPVPINPEDSSFTDLMPILYLSNSVDPELDSLCYAFQIWADTELLITESPWVSEQQDSTLWQSDVELIENRQHWWRAKSSDYYEESGWSNMVMFYANSVNTAPSEFSLILPPDSSGQSLNTLQPMFYWSASSDPDPLDSILYDLRIATDSNFIFFNEVEDIDTTQCILPFELEWGERFWWKVKAEDQYGGLTWSSNVLNFWTMICGDANNDKDVNVSDAVYIINYVFMGGDPPQPIEAGNVNCDGDVNISDAVWLLNYVFLDGPLPCECK